jgi:hypothetical protein
VGGGGRGVNMPEFLQFVIYISFQASKSSPSGLVGCAALVLRELAVCSEVIYLFIYLFFVMGYLKYLF